MSEPTFHKILLAPGHELPITAVVVDADDVKQRYKFKYHDPDADHTSPGTLRPQMLDESDALDSERTAANLAAAVDGVNTHTAYSASLDDE